MDFAEVIILDNQGNLVNEVRFSPKYLLGYQCGQQALHAQAWPQRLLRPEVIHKLLPLCLQSKGVFMMLVIPYV